MIQSCVSINAFFKFFASEYCRFISSLHLLTVQLSDPLKGHKITSVTAYSPGGGGTPYNGLYGKNPSERGTFFRFEKDADFTIGKSAIWQSKEQKSKQKDLMGVKKARKSPDFVIYLTINE